MLLATAAAVAGLLARGPRLLVGLMAVGGAAAVWHAVTTPEPAATVGSHAGAVAAAALPALTAAGVSLVGLRAALRGRGAMAGLLAVVLGWLLLIQGLPDVDVLWTAHVLATGPQLLARAAVAVLVALGAGLVVGGIAAARRFREHGPHRSGVPAPGALPA